MFWPKGKHGIGVVSVPTKTKGGAWHLSSGIAIVPLEGYGGKPLSLVDVIPHPANVSP